LAAHGILGIPTESSYALAVDPRSSEGVETIFRFKQRPADKPLPVVIGALEHLELLGIDTQDPDLRALASLWPSPLSVVVPIHHPLPAACGSGSLAVRMPDHKGLVEMLIGLQTPLTATSANRSGEPPIRDPMELADKLNGWRALIVDDGCLVGGAPSTMVTLRSGDLEVLRMGRYPIAVLERKLSDLGWGGGFSAAVAEKSADRSSEAR
jgi:L-threonylcarbamoyladenylate synthase